MVPNHLLNWMILQVPWDFEDSKGPHLVGKYIFTSLTPNRSPNTVDGSEIRRKKNTTWHV